MGNIDFITGRYSAKRSDAYHDASLRDHSRNARTPLLLGFVAKFSQSRVLGQSSREKYAYFGDVPELSYNTVYDRSKAASLPNARSVHVF